MRRRAKGWSYLPWISGALTAAAFVFGVGSKSCTGHFSIAEGLYWLLWYSVGGATLVLAIILMLLFYGIWRLALRKSPEHARRFLQPALLSLPALTVVLAVVLTPHYKGCVYI